MPHNVCKLRVYIYVSTLTVASALHLGRGARRDRPQEEACDGIEQMLPRVWTFRVLDCVGAIWIAQHLKLLVLSDELVQQHLHVLYIDARHTKA